MLQTPAVQRMQLVTALAHIRREWQDATSGKSLLEVVGNMGMLLAGLINNIGLPIEQQVAGLGKRIVSGNARTTQIPCSQLNHVPAGPERLAQHSITEG